MKAGRVVGCGVVVIILFAAVLTAVGGSPRRSGVEEAGTPANHYALLARSTFLENVGQLRNNEIRYYLSTPGFSAGFAQSAVFWSLMTGSPSSSSAPFVDSTSVWMRGALPRGVLVRLSFQGSNPVIPGGNVEVPYRTNFLVGESEIKWHTDVRSYQEIEYKGLYDGIDLIYRAAANGVKYEFIVGVGADPSSIAITFEGADSLGVEGDGSLVVHTALGDVRDTAPTARQGEMVAHCGFYLRSPRSLAFLCTGWDRSQPLVIDPLVYSTFIGGSAGIGAGDDGSYAIAVDSAGSAYIAGFTETTDFPITPGAFDSTFVLGEAFVVKLTPAGDALAYSTFLGGSDGEAARAIAVDAQGNAYVAGWTYSGNFPVTPGAYDTTYNYGEDAFVVKLNPTGRYLLYGTYLGGSNDDEARGIAVDNSGNAYVTGFTRSSDFPTTPGAFDQTFGPGVVSDSFVTKLNPQGSGVGFSTFLGGSGNDDPLSIAVDNAGEAFVAGHTSSFEFPTTPGSWDRTVYWEDGFLVKLNASGSGIVFGTFIGGTGLDWAFGVALDPSSNSYVVGYTDSPDFVTTSGAWDTIPDSQGDAFVVSFDPIGGLRYSTLLGGTGNEGATAVAADAKGIAYVVGSTSTSDFPTTPGALEATPAGGGDGFVTALDPSGTTLIYSTYLGGSAGDAPYGIAVDGQNGTYVTGATGSADFPTTPGAYDRTLTGPSDAFSLKLSILTFQVALDTSPSSLLVQFDGKVYTAPQSLRCLQGSSHNISAPSPQLAGAMRSRFVSWSDSGAQTHSISCDAPATYSATFRTEYQITIDTSPGGLAISLDGVTYVTPVLFWCDAGSVHSVDTASPQGSGGTRYSFVNWSDGGAQAHSIVCLSPGTITATFAVVHEIVVNTSPVGLMIEVDGLPQVAPNSFWCEAGSMHSLNASSPQGGGTTRFSFANWSDGGARAHLVTCDRPATYTAFFNLEYKANVVTSPAGLQVEVDGTTTVAPLMVWWLAGSVHRIGAPSPQVAGLVRFVFSGWSDTGGEFHDVTASGPATYVANFSTQYQTTIDTTPSGLQFLLDGSAMSAPAGFWCGAGTSHSLDAPSPQGSGSTRYRFSGWTDGASQTRIIVCDSPAAYTAQFTTEFLIVLATSPSNLQLVIDGNPATAPFSLWWAEGSIHTVSTLSPQGSGSTRHVFINWSDTGALTHSVTVAGPQTLTANFGAEFQVFVDTMPAGLALLVDGLPYSAPQSFWWAEGSQHTLGTVSPQTLPGTRFLFQSWSDGGAETHLVLVSGATTYAAGFSTEFEMAIDTSPGGLQVEVDGAPFPTPYAFWCGEGTQRTIAVPSPQPFGTTRYLFSTWSDRGSQSHSIGCDAPKSFVATFETEYWVLLDSSPSGLEFLVDGTTYSAPHGFWWSSASNHSLDSLSPQSELAGARFRWLGWSDGRPQAHVITIDGPMSVTVRFQRQFLLIINSRYGSPACDVPACWYDEGATATFSVVSPAAGPVGTRYVFGGWTGDGTGTTQSSTILMDTPKIVSTTWATEYLLTVTSALGTPSGGGWYSMNTLANFSVSPLDVYRDGSHYRFSGWAGDLVGGTPSGTVRMEGPKTVTAVWREVAFFEDFWWLVSIPIAILGVVAALLIWRRRRRDEPERKTTVQKR